MRIVSSPHAYQNGAAAADHTPHFAEGLDPILAGREMMQDRDAHRGVETRIAERESGRLADDPAEFRRRTTGGFRTTNRNQPAGKVDARHPMARVRQGPRMTSVTASDIEDRRSRGEALDEIKDL